MSIYDFNVKDTKQNQVKLESYRGKVLLIINSATSCGFTPQYEGIEKLYRTYRSKGLEVLDFPCNQFMAQAKGSDQELATFCQINYDTTFQTFAKIKVNGKDAHPLFVYLKNQQPKDHAEASEKKGLKSWLGKLLPNQSIRWNFTKFLVDRNGQVIHRFGPTFRPEDIEPFIQKAL